MSAAPRRLTISVACLAALLLLWAYREPPALSAPTTAPSTAPSPQAVAQLASANARFAFKLFAELLKEQPRDNIFVSPVSVSLALAMAYNGAGGATRQAMAKGLEIQRMSVRDVNQANLALANSLGAPHEGVKLSIANSLWGNNDKGITFSPAFLKVDQEFYGARAAGLDFAGPDASGTINKWVEQQTEGKISRIVGDKELGNLLLVLINAVYFRGRWTSVFDPDQTENRPFTLLDGTKKTVAMMSKADDYPYFKGEGFQAISLPYGDEERFRMCVFLPNEKSSLAEFCRSLNAEQWTSWMGELKRQTGLIELPRFKVEYDAELSAALKALGMGAAFDGGADFGAMLQPAQPRFWIGEVKHKTYIEVKEEGTEAAAVTELGGAGAAPGHHPPPPFVMVVDHPFFCAIRDEETGSLLFMGAIVDPGEVAR